MRDAQPSAPADLEDLVRRDRERWLAILWAPAVARPAMQAVAAFDEEQRRLTVEAREPLLAEIRLAWWREQLSILATSAKAPPQPILRALQDDAMPRGVDLADLSLLEDAWLPLLTEGPIDALALARARGGPLFRAFATALAGSPPNVDEMESATQAGTRWALSRLWRGGWGRVEGRLRAMDAPQFPPTPQSPLPRPLMMLDRLAAADWKRLQAGQPLAEEASPGRQWLMMRIGLFGR